jgi:flagellar biogenesis protein FliO
MNSSQGRRMKFSFLTLMLIMSGSVVFFTNHASANSLTVRDILLGGKNQIEIRLDGTAAKSAMDIDYVRDIVQFSIQNATIYPAKIVHAENQSFSKVFAYQYSPNLVRIRFSVDGKADSFSGKVKWQQKGKSIFVTFPEGVVAAPLKDDSSQERSLLAKVLGQGKKEAVKVEEIKPEAEAKEERAQEAKLKQEIAQEKSESASNEKNNAEKSAAKIDENNTNTGGGYKFTSEKSLKSNKLLGNASSPSLGGQKAGTSAFRSFLAMFCVVGGLGLVLIYVKKKQGSVQAKKVGDNWLSNLLPQSMRKQKSFIEVLGTHALGAKQSIVVIRIKGQQMVLGVTQDNVQLITQLEADDSELGLLDDPAVAASIGKMFGGAPTVAPVVTMPKGVQTNASFNSMLKGSTGAGAIIARNAYQSQSNEQNGKQISHERPVARAAAPAHAYSSSDAAPFAQEINPVRAQANSIRNQIKKRLEDMKNG